LHIRSSSISICYQYILTWSLHWFEYESHHTDREEDDEEIVTNEILSVANALEEEVVQDEEVVVAVVVDDGKVACDICGKRVIYVEKLYPYLGIIT
jgi:hypothetical protein